MPWRWTLANPNLGDPTPLGWLTTIGYFVACALALRAARATRLCGPTDRPLVRFWLLVTAVLLALGFNKQLDLQLWLTDLGRTIALAQGWYEARQWVQIGFVILAGLATDVAVLCLLMYIRDFLPRASLALVGLLLLVTFTLLRAISIDVIDVQLRAHGENLTWVLEVTGILIIAVAAALATQAAERSRRIT